MSVEASRCHDFWNLGERKVLERLRSPIAFALATSLFILTFDNWRFWSETLSATRLDTPEEVFFLLSIGVIVVLLQAVVLLAAPRILPLRVFAITAILVAAVTGFFIDSYSVVVDKEMIRNLFETDTREAAAFLVPKFAVYVLMLGILPAVIAARFKLTTPTVKNGSLQRIGFVALALATCLGLFLASFPHFTSFFGEHKTQNLLNPAQPVIGLVAFVQSSLAAVSTTFVDDAANHAQLLPTPKGKPLLLFLVVGESARAANFQLGGYQRPTNRELARVTGLHYFTHAKSCGTSTAFSVPCMFSPTGRQNFDVAETRRHSNLVDALASAGFDVEWRDNNSSSKGVAARVPVISFVRGDKAAACGPEGCLDEQTLEGLPSRLAGLTQNTVIVFHDLGSHGPAYWKRYPAKFEHFKPVCRTSELWTCSQESLVNTYDNTILYADHVLAERIRLLQSVSEKADTLLIYVSDHGESLGEHGIYLHGAPYAIAPKEQTTVPYLIWMSPEYRDRVSVDTTCIQSKQGDSISHDSLYHTVLGALGARNAFYRPELDIVGPCWRNKMPTVSRAQLP